MAATASPPRVAVVLPMDVDAVQVDAVLAAFGVTGQAGAAESLSLADYHLFLAEVPAELRRATEARWGGPETDPLFRPGETDCGGFRLPLRSFGHLVLALDAGWRPPRHGDLALAAWLGRSFRADWLLLSAGARVAAVELLSARIETLDEEPDPEPPPCSSTPT